MDPNMRFREISPAPETEAARLREVHRLASLARHTQNQLHCFCRVAAEMFRVPIAAITLVDETEIQILACHGAAVSSFPRERSLCSCVILRRDAFIVRDLDAELADLRDLPCQQELPLRFYAAVPLTSWAGHNVGTLFVADVIPHDATESQVDALADLGHLVMLEMERQGTLQESQRHNSIDSRFEDEFVRFLAKGAAHDFGELITGWISTVDALEKELLPGSEEHELVGQLSRSLIPAARLTDHLKLFTSAIHEPADALPLNQLVDRAMKMLRHVVRPEISIQFRRDRAIEGMKIDTRDLQLALAILVSQANDAMPDAGEISVSTGLERFDEPHFTRFLELPPDLYATVTIGHTGRPMNAEEQRGLLQSKPQTGSLSSPFHLAARIVGRAGGGIDLCTIPDFGESVTIYLPVSWRPLPLSAESIKEGKIHILLVENHEVVLRGVYSALLRRGYRVTTAENGAEALQKFPDGEGFDMVVTDVVMHPVDGVAMVERFREMRPSLVDQVASLLPDRTAEA